MCTIITAKSLGSRNFAHGRMQLKGNDARKQKCWYCPCLYTSECALDTMLSESKVFTASINFRLCLGVKGLARRYHIEYLGVS